MEKLINCLMFILLFLWQLPQNIVALVMMPFLGKLRLISYRRFCFAFEGSKMMGGISLGSFAFLSPRSARSPESVAHEQLGHTVDSKIYGPLYLLVIGLPSVLHAWLHKNCPCYYHFYTERRANEFAGLRTVKTSRGHCYLVFKDKEEN